MTGEGVSGQVTQVGICPSPLLDWKLMQFRACRPDHEDIPFGA
jgi:hypothetical protein